MPTKEKKTIKSAMLGLVNKLTKKAPAKKAAAKPAKKKVAKKPAAKAKKPVVKKVVKAKPKKAVVKAKPVKAKALAKKAAVAKPAKVAKTEPVKKATKKDTPAMTKSNLTTTIEKPEAKPKATPIIKEKIPVNTATMEEVDFVPYEIENSEDYMTNEQLEHFRKILLRWKQQLMQEVDSTVGHMQKDGLSFADPIDRASQEEGFNLELRTRDRERKLIKKIESSLDNIETGDYGFCEDCGADIGVRRLEARPTAKKCIDCKTYSEIRERQSGGG